MTKKDYLTYKQTDPMAIMYEYYKEKFDKSKHKHFMSRKEFDTFAPMYTDVNSAYIKACQHYDTALQVVELRDKQGNPIMIF
jgi:hypothetical protein